MQVLFEWAGRHSVQCVLLGWGVQRRLRDQRLVRPRAVGPGCTDPLPTCQLFHTPAPEREAFTTWRIGRSEELFVLH